MVPVWVMKYLKGADLAVYLSLRSFADRQGNAWPHAKTIAERAGVAVGTARNAIQKMRQLGLITTTENTRSDGSLSGLNYFMRDVEPKKSRPKSTISPEIPMEGSTPDDVPPSPPGCTPIEGRTHQENTPSKELSLRSSSSRVTGKAMPIPEDYEPSPALRQWAWDKHRLRSEVVDAEIEIFKDHHIAKGSAMKSWDAAARTWLARVNSFSRPSSNGNGSKPEQSTKSTSDERAEQALRAGRDLAAKIAAGGPLGLLEGGGYQ